jgi:hypothetical protein
MKTNYVTLVIAIIGAFGGWILTLSGWDVALQTTNLGGLMISLASVIGAWYAKSPRASQ